MAATLGDRLTIELYQVFNCRQLTELVVEKLMIGKG